MKRNFRRFCAPSIMLGLGLLLGVGAFATPVTFTPGSTLTINQTGTVAVDGLYIDQDYTGTPVGGTPNPPLASECPGVNCKTAVDGDGSGVYITSALADTGTFFGLTGTIDVHDLCRDTTSATCPTPVPVGVSTTLSNFVTFSANTWAITLTQLDVGDYANTACFTGSGTGTAGQTCTPTVGTVLSPFDLTNVGNSPGGPVTGVNVSFSFKGTIQDGDGGPPAAIIGTFSSNFTGIDFQTILADINAGDAVLDGATSTLTVQSGVPEPNTLALMIIGGMLIGCSRIRRRA